MSKTCLSEKAVPFVYIRCMAWHADFCLQQNFSIWIIWGFLGAETIISVCQTILHAAALKLVKLNCLVHSGVRSTSAFLYQVFSEKGTNSAFCWTFFLCCVVVDGPDIKSWPVCILTNCIELYLYYT